MDTFGLSQFIALRPFCLIRRAEHFHYLIELINLIRPRKQGTKGIELSHYTTQREYVDR